MSNEFGRPPLVAEWEKHSKVHRQLYSERRNAYWFEGRVGGVPAALRIGIGGTATLISLLLHRGALSTNLLGSVTDLRIERRDDRIEFPDIGDHATIAFRTPEHAAHVQRVLVWLAYGDNRNSVSWGSVDVLLSECVYLGGVNIPLTVGDVVDVAFRPDRIDASHSPMSPAFAADWSIPLIDVDGLELGGPGVVTSGGGFVGGGFGITGALEGVAIAETLNRLTTRRKTWTTITISAPGLEAFFLTTEHEPEQLRRTLSPTYVRLTRFAAQISRTPTTGNAVASGLERLAALRQTGALTDQEFEAAKRTLLE